MSATTSKKALTAAERQAEWEEQDRRRDERLLKMEESTLKRLDAWEAKNRSPRAT